jgi:hypothetical protein
VSLPLLLLLLVVVEVVMGIMEGRPFRVGKRPDMNAL